MYSILLLFPSRHTLIPEESPSPLLSLFKMELYLIFPLDFLVELGHRDPLDFCFLFLKNLVDLLLFGCKCNTYLQRVRSEDLSATAKHLILTVMLQRLKKM